MHGSRNETSKQCAETTRGNPHGRKGNRALKNKLAMSSGRDLAASAIDIGGV